jgi:F-box-like
MDNLPDELLLKIFDLIDNRTIKRSVIHVSDRWRSLIFSSTSLVSKHQLLIDYDNFKDFSAKDLEFPYHNYTVNLQNYYYIDPLYIVDRQLKSIINRNVENITFLKPTPGLVTKVLGGLEHLTHLTIEEMQTSLAGNFCDFDEHPVNLPSLKYLEVNGTNSFLKMFKNHKVETLKITNFSNNPNTVSRSLNYFLKNAPLLRNFHFCASSPKLDYEKFNFKLETFEWMNIELTNLQGEESPIIELLRSQKENIKEFTAKGFVGGKIVEMAVNTLKVTKLAIDMEKTFTEPEDLKTNHHIRHLKILNLPNDIQHAIKLIVHCPKVQNLSVHGPIPLENFNDFMLNVSQTMQNLRKLDFWHISGICSVTFDQLEELSFFGNNMSNFSSVIAFTRGCRNLKSLKIKNFEYELAEGDLKNLLINLSQLEALNISGNFPLNLQTTKVFFDTQSNLKYLTLDIEVDRNVAGNVSILNYHPDIQVTIPKLIQFLKMDEEEHDTDPDDLDVEETENEFDDDEEDMFDVEEEHEESMTTKASVLFDNFYHPDSDDEECDHEGSGTTKASVLFDSSDVLDSDNEECYHECSKNSLKRPNDHDDEEDEESDGFVDENDEYGLLQEIKRPRRS